MSYPTLTAWPGVMGCMATAFLYSALSVLCTDLGFQGRTVTVEQFDIFKTGWLACEPRFQCTRGMWLSVYSTLFSICICLINKDIKWRFALSHVRYYCSTAEEKPSPWVNTCNNKQWYREWWSCFSTGGKSPLLSPCISVCNIATGTTKHVWVHTCGLSVSD